MRYVAQDHLSTDIYIGLQVAGKEVTLFLSSIAPSSFSPLFFYSDFNIGGDSPRYALASSSLGVTLACHLEDFSLLQDRHVDFLTAKILSLLFTVEIFWHCLWKIYELACWDEQRSIKFNFISYNILVAPVMQRILIFHIFYLPVSNTLSVSIKKTFLEMMAVFWSHICRWKFLNPRSP